MKEQTKFMRNVIQAIIYGLAIVWLIITLYPFIFLLQNSFKAGTEFYRISVWALPEKFSLSNYIRIWQNHLTSYVVNSVILSGASLILIVLGGSAAAFGLSRLRFKGQTFFYLLFVVGLTIPVHVTLIPIYSMTQSLGLYDSLLALIGPYVAGAMPMTIIILRSFMNDIPGSLEEAAYIDGATRWDVYWNVVLPISQPALIAVGIFNLVALWNEFIFALTLISSEAKRRLTLALWNFQGQYQTDVPAMMTALLLSSLPVLFLYGIAKEKLIEGLTAGAVKG